MRVLKGYATTSDVDVVGDIVRPEGVMFNKMPLPLLGGHDHKLPIGTVVSAKADSKGVMITAHLIPKGESRTADDWAAAAKYGAAQAFSIGFRSAGATANKHGGKTYDTALVHEVSLVVVPANSACVAKYVETPDATPAAVKPAPVKPQATKPSPKATEATKAVRIPLILISGHEAPETLRGIEEHNQRALAHNKRHGL